MLIEGFPVPGLFSPFIWQPVQGQRRLHAMESVAPLAGLFRLPRCAGATLLTLISAGCLTLSYTHERSFGLLLRIAVGLGLPWIVASLVPAKQPEQSHGVSRRGYWFRVVFSYLLVVVIGVVVVLILPFVMMVLMELRLNVNLRIWCHSVDKCR